MIRYYLKFSKTITKSLNNTIIVNNVMSNITELRRRVWKHTATEQLHVTIPKDVTNIKEGDIVSIKKIKEADE